ncbi:MAG: GNAT family N-acetyltransferase [Anaerolineaceae bacterium]
MNVIPLQPEGQLWLPAFFCAHWGSEEVVVHETVYHPARLPGFCVRMDGEIVGVITYSLTGDACEIVSLDSLRPGQGIGSALMITVEEVARASGCRSVWLVTTNDNLNALRFYQKRGYRLVKLRPGAVDQARQLKPQIPCLGEDGIPIRDELEFEKKLDRGRPD